MENEEALPEFVRMCLQSSELIKNWNWWYGDEYYSPSTHTFSRLTFMYHKSNDAIPLPTQEDFQRLMGGDIKNILFYTKRIIDNIQADVNLDPVDMHIFRKEWLKQYMLVKHSKEWNGVNWMDCSVMK